MWTRSLLKQNAWNNLKGYYWPALGVTLLANIMGANGGGFSGGGGGSSAYSDYSDTGSSSDSDIDPGAAVVIMMVALAVAFVVMAIGFAYTCFVGNVAKCGECKYFVTARNGDQKFVHLFDNFRGGNYMPTVKTMFFYWGEIFLWSLLFLIPGIIKSYEYELVPYLVAENPNIDRKRAKEISRQAMDGEKWNFFVLRLSFIGWYLLGYLACCVGAVAVVPYQMATEAEFYMCMRAKMLSFGYTTEEELTGGFFNGMGGSDPSDFGGNGNFGGGSYNEPNFRNNAYSVPNTASNPYETPQQPNNGYGAPPVNPNDQYGGVMPGIDDPANPYDQPNDPNNPYNQ